MRYPRPSPRGASRLAALGLCLSCVTVAPSLAGLPGTTKVLVDSGMGDSVRLVQASGGRLLAHRGEYDVYSVASGVTLAGAGVTPRPDMDQVFLRRGAVDTRVAPLSAANRRLQLVQFDAPPTQAEFDALAKAGAQVVQYIPENAYIVWTSPSGAVLAGRLGATGTYVSDYGFSEVLDPQLDSALDSKSLVDVTVQVFNFQAEKGEATPQDIVGDIIALSDKVLAPPASAVSDRYTNIRLRVDGQALGAIASMEGVVNVEPWIEPRRNSEVQSQVMAGAVDASGAPTGPGYLAFLTARGFSTTAADYPIVCVTDDGIGNGTTTTGDPVLHVLGNTANATRVIFNNSALGDGTTSGVAGHGHINSSIVAGYDLRTASSGQWNGYQRAIGISPYGRVAGYKIFTDAGSYDISGTGGTLSGLYSAEYTAGARISSNSWGAPVSGAYNADSQSVDSLARDATATAGNQEMVFVFSAGNSGSGAGTIGSPGTAKNILSVGATQDGQETGVTDGCGEAGGASIFESATFSSRGPCTDGRIKPDITAPGVHVSGTASTATGFDGSGVCGLPTGSYHPTGQTVYTWSSGTSHSCPAVAGWVQLISRYLVAQYGFGDLGTASGPSAALVKAYAINSTRYLSGATTSGNLPTSTQGFGFPDGSLAFSTGAARFFRNQQDLFTVAGASNSYSGTVIAGQPFRVTLAWTDAPGATTGAAYVNDLDLEVTVGGNTYFGNVFTGASSVSGGTRDTKNNTECVFLPSASGAATIKVIARTLAGDGVPGNATATDQDYALVAYNFQQAALPSLGFNGSPTIDDSVGQGTDNGNGQIDPGESAIQVTIPLINSGTAAGTGISAHLSTSTPNVTVAQADSAYPDMAIGATGSNTTAFVLSVGSGFTCGSSIALQLDLTYAQGSSSLTPSLPTGRAGTASPHSYTSTDVPKVIPDNTAAGVDSTIVVSGLPGAITDVNVTGVNITHSYDGDLALTLISPSGASVALSTNRGGSANDYTNTNFDDSAATAISAGTAPFTGTFKPESVLSALNGGTANGTWKLHVVDSASIDTGSITAWGITVTTQDMICDPALTSTPTPSPTPTATPTPTASSTPSATPSPSPTPSPTPVNQPPSAAAGRPVLAVRVSTPSIDPEGGAITYRYDWTSTGGDAPITHGPSSSLTDSLSEATSTATFDDGEVWTVHITPIDPLGAEGPSFIGTFIIGSGGTVTFSGWATR